MHLPRRLAALGRDESGASAVFTALGLTAVLGFLAVGIGATTGLVTKRQAQAAADAAAEAGARNIRSGLAPVPMALAVASENLKDAAVAVQWPPTDGAHRGNPLALAVSVSVEQRYPLGAFLGESFGTVAARAVAAVVEKGPACVLALAGSGEAIGIRAGAALLLDGCIALTKDSGIPLVRLPSANPYVIDFPPSPCTPGTRTITGTVTYRLGQPIMPRCGGVVIRSGGRLIVEGIALSVGGPLVVEPGGTLETREATIIAGRFPVDFRAGARVDLVAPRTGSTAGIAILGSRQGDEVTSRLLAGQLQSLKGAIVLPAQRVELAGNGASCTQVIARQIAIEGTTHLRHACAGAGTQPISDKRVALAE
ncbi:MAG: pilus assembly protein TadG-related protein [Sphingomonadaceae bacterium]